MAENVFSDSLKNSAHAGFECADCHQALTPGEMPQHGAIKPVECANCHDNAAAIVAQSPHGKNGHGPTCSRCHGAHAIAKHPEKPDAATMLASAQKCGSCHQHMYQSFAISYHGLALRTGSTQSATCTHCHGSHAILANQDSMAAACASCHPGANNRFLQGRMHVFAESKTPAILYWIRLLYLAFIGVVIGGMVAHNGLDLIKRIRIRLSKPLKPVHGNAQFLRMTLNERLQHGLLLVSFITLVITGFMLRYPDSWWAAPLFALSPKVAVARALLHRIAGAAMLLAGVYHIGYAVFTKRGRNLIRDIFPRFSDIKDSFAYVLYNLGLRKDKPRFDRFNYIEKSEYWAMVWGTIVMGATGLFMWFENFFIARFTKLGWDIARTVHFYEAVLAGLAILVWHFYVVVLSIDICPFKRAWITGKISEAEMLEDHPLELERIRAAEFKRLEDGEPR